MESETCALTDTKIVNGQEIVLAFFDPEIAINDENSSLYDTYVDMTYWFDTTNVLNWLRSSKPVDLVYKISLFRGPYDGYFKWVYHGGWYDYDKPRYMYFMTHAKVWDDFTDSSKSKKEQIEDILEVAMIARRQVFWASSNLGLANIKTERAVQTRLLDLTRTLL